MRLRETIGRAFRAPTVEHLFAIHFPTEKEGAPTPRSLSRLPTLWSQSAMSCSGEDTERLYSLGLHTCPRVCCLARGLLGVALALVWRVVPRCSIHEGQYFYSDSVCFLEIRLDLSKHSKYTHSNDH